MIEFAWFIIGLTFGVCGTIGYVMYIGHREIKKRNKRATEWQKKKKTEDKEIKERWGL